MKFIFFLMLISTTSFSQIMSTHLLSYSNSINPIFSKKSKSINLSFDKIKLLDTVSEEKYILKIDISDRKSELSGISNDFNLAGGIAALNNYGLLGGALALGLNSSKQFSIKNTNGSVALNHTKFDSLFKFSNRIVKLIDSGLSLDPISISYYFKVDNIEMSLEVEQTISSTQKMDVNGNKFVAISDKKVFLKIDESVFIMSDSEFKKFTNETLGSINKLWPK
jgi:hypothetical protein